MKATTHAELYRPFKGTLRPPRSPPSAVTTSFEPQSLMRSARLSGLSRT